MNSQNIFTTIKLNSINLRHYLLPACIGIIGGGTGMILVLGGGFLLQMAAPAMAFFQLPPVLLAVAVALSGIPTSWGYMRLAARLIPSLFEGIDNHGLQTVLMSGVITGLLEAVLFF